MVRRNREIHGGVERVVERQRCGGEEVKCNLEMAHLVAGKVNSELVLMLRDSYQTASVTDLQS